MMRDEVYSELDLYSGPVVVGVDASAREPDAVRSLLYHLPAAHSLAIILVQQFDPSRERLLAQHLSKTITASIEAAEDGKRVESGHVYLAGPGQRLTLDKGRLRLDAVSDPKGMRCPIDAFFESLAANAGARGVAINLSGTCSDGAVGARAIKQAGGLVLVQDLQKPSHNGMHKSMTEMGADDLVLPPHEMIGVINDYFSIGTDLKPGILSDNAFIDRITKHLKYRTGQDFGDYEQSTMLRRLDVRMSVLGISNPNDYVQELIANKAEATQLCRELMQNVTGLFCNADAFDAFQMTAFPDNLQRKGENDDLRIWMPGCATGEEASRQNSNEPFARTLIAKFAPPFVVANQDGNLIYASEKAVPYLQIKPGSTRLSLTQLIVPELEPGLRQLLGRTAPKTSRSEEEFRGKLAGRDARVILSLEDLDDGTRLLVIEDRLVLNENQATLVAGCEVRSNTSALDPEGELENAHETIHSTAEEFAASNQEHKSSNEEMMSVSEKLPSGIKSRSTANEEFQNKISALREANDDLANLMRSTNVIALFLDAELRLRFFTPASQSVFRFDDADRGRRIDDIGSNVDMGRLRDRCVEVLKTGLPIEQEIETHNGDRRYTLKVMEYYGRGSATSNGIVCTMSDITALSQAVIAAQTERRISQRSLAEIEQLYLVSPQAMALLAPDTTYLRVNRQMAEINGLGVEAHFGERMCDIVPDLCAQTSAALERVLTMGEPVVDLLIEGVADARTEERRLFSTDWYPVRIDNEIVAVGVNFRDITDQTEMQLELRRIMQELQHRVKNMLSNVLALVSRASRDANADVRVLDTLALRIRALSKTHKLLTEENWRAANIYALIEPELTDLYGSERVHLAGPNMLVNARAAVALGMAIHELATNAVKYGAFSQGEGNISLTWVRIDDGADERVVFRWVESGGPKVDPAPGAGFGSQLIASTITGSLHGSIDTDWHEDGLVVEMTVPFETLSKLKEDVVYDIF